MEEGRRNEIKVEGGSGVEERHKERNDREVNWEILERMGIGE